MDVNRVDFDMYDINADTALKKVLDDLQEGLAAIVEHVEAELGERSGICTWTPEADDERIYETTCGQSFLMEEGTPQENDMNFCCFCGKKLAVGVVEPEAEGEQA